MATRHLGRYSAQLDGDFVVFLIGMRLNRPWKVHQWWPVFGGMQRMLAELARHPERGLLGAHAGLLHGGPAVVQYWRSFEHLDRFARDPASLHLPAWRWFNRAVKASGDVGIWHETYLVRAGAYEAIYGNMPRIGLAAAGDHVAIARRGQSAARRVGVSAGDEVAVAGYPNP
jgi:Monooxygenase af470-like